MICKKCKGEGRIDIVSEDFSGHVSKRCSDCRGTGVVGPDGAFVEPPIPAIDPRCSKCGGLATPYYRAAKKTESDSIYEAYLHGHKRLCNDGCWEHEHIHLVCKCGHWWPVECLDAK